MFCVVWVRIVLLVVVLSIVYLSVVGVCWVEVILCRDCNWNNVMLFGILIGFVICLGFSLVSMF